MIPSWQTEKGLRGEQEMEGGLQVLHLPTWWQGGGLQWSGVLEYWKLLEQPEPWPWHLIQSGVFLQVIIIWFVKDIKFHIYMEFSLLCGSGSTSKGTSHLDVLPKHWSIYFSKKNQNQRAAGYLFKKNEYTHFGIRFGLCQCQCSVSFWLPYLSLTTATVLLSQSRYNCSILNNLF